MKTLFKKTLESVCIWFEKYGTILSFVVGVVIGCVGVLLKIHWLILLFSFSGFLILVFWKYREKINNFFSVWLPSITVVAVLLPFLGTIISYNFMVADKNRENEDRNTRLEQQFILETCLNRKNAEIIKTGQDGGRYVFNTPYYSTSFYKNNWLDLLEIIESKQLDSGKLYDMIRGMENQNRMLDNNNFRPSDDLASGAEHIIVILDELNFPDCR